MDYGALSDQDRGVLQQAIEAANRLYLSSQPLIAALPHSAQYQAPPHAQRLPQPRAPGFQFFVLCRDRAVGMARTVVDRIKPHTEPLQLSG